MKINDASTHVASVSLISRMSGCRDALGATTPDGAEREAFF